MLLAMMLFTTSYLGPGRLLLWWIALLLLIVLLLLMLTLLWVLLMLLLLMALLPTAEYFLEEPKDLIHRHHGEGGLGEVAEASDRAMHKASQVYRQSGRVGRN